MHTPRSRVLVLTLLLALLVPGVGHAVPDELTGRLSAARDQLAALHARASQAVEEHNVAAAELEQVEAERARTGDRVDELAAEVAALEESIAGFVRSMYMRGPTTALTAVLDTEEMSDAGRSLATVDRLSRQRHVEVEELALRRGELEDARGQLDRQVAEAQQRAEDVARRRGEVEVLLADQRDEVEQLQQQVEELERQEAEEAARRAREAAERRQREQAEQDQPQQVTAPRTTTDSGPQTDPARDSAAPPEPAPAGTRTGADVAVDAALSQVGKPYRWAGAGPNSYDCSGLTMWAWRHAGVSLPHSSRMQYSTTTRISRNQLQPGDLVFFGSPIHHVAMYIGNGRVVEAPSAGKHVRVNSSALSRSDITGYGRV